MARCALNCGATRQIERLWRMLIAPFWKRGLLLLEPPLIGGSSGAINCSGRITRYSEAIQPGGSMRPIADPIRTRRNPELRRPVGE
jgi:hypothetical protein